MEAWSCPTVLEVMVISFWVGLSKGSGAALVPEISGIQLILGCIVTPETQPLLTFTNTPALNIL